MRRNLAVCPALVLRVNNRRGQGSVSPTSNVWMHWLFNFSIPLILYFKLATVEFITTVRSPVHSLRSNLVVASAGAFCIHRVGEGSFYLFKSLSTSIDITQGPFSLLKNSPTGSVFTVALWWQFSLTLTGISSHMSHTPVQHFTVAKTINIGCESTLMCSIQQS